MFLPLVSAAIGHFGSYYHCGREGSHSFPLLRRRTVLSAWPSHTCHCPRPMRSLLGIQSIAFLSSADGHLEEAKIHVKVTRDGDFGDVRTVIRASDLGKKIVELNQHNRRLQH